MSIEELQAIIREVLKEFEAYEEGDEDLINLLSEKIFFELSK